MIKRIGLLLPFTLLYGEPALFLLPDEQSRFVHYLAQKLNGRSGEVLIVTPAFRHPELKKALLQGGRKGNRVTLITQELKGDPLSMVQYEYTDLYTYTSRPIQGSVILIGDRLVCTFSGGIEEEKFSLNAALARCSDDAAEAAASRVALLPLIKRSKKYLK